MNIKKLIAILSLAAAATAAFTLAGCDLIMGPNQSGSEQNGSEQGGTNQGGGDDNNDNGGDKDKDNSGGGSNGGNAGDNNGGNNGNNNSSGDNNNQGNGQGNNNNQGNVQGDNNQGNGQGGDNNQDNGGDNNQGENQGNGGDNNQGGNGDQNGNEGGNQGGDGDEGGEPITDEFISLNSASDYGYNWLAAQPDGSALQAFYRQLDARAKQVENGTVNVTTTQYHDDYENKTYTYNTAGKLESSTLTSRQLCDVYRVYLYDHPYNFWQNGVCLMGTSGGKSYIHLLLEDGFNSGSDVLTAKAAINDNIKKAYALADGIDSAYEASFVFNQYLVERVDYSFIEVDGLLYPEGSPYAHDITGIFDDDDNTGAVCEGYARSFQLLLNLKNIENVYVVGEATSIGTGGGGGHAWNMVKLDDGYWYYYDVTWNDGNGGADRLTYFAVSAADTPDGYPFTVSHTAGTTDENSSYYLYDLPTNVATASYGEGSFIINAEYETDDFIFVRNGLDTVSIKRIKPATRVINIPESVTVQGKTYRVTAIGPNNNGNVYSTVLVSNQVSELIIPASVKVIDTAAFNCMWQFKVWYYGTEEEWSKIAKGQAAFGGIEPEVHYAGEWVLFGNRPIAK